MLQIVSSSHAITLSPQPSRQALMQIKELGDGTFVAIASSARCVLNLMCGAGGAYRHAPPTPHIKLRTTLAELAIATNAPSPNSFICLRAWREGCGERAIAWGDEAICSIAVKRRSDTQMRKTRIAILNRAKADECKGRLMRPDKTRQTEIRPPSSMGT